MEKTETETFVCHDCSATFSIRERILTNREDYVCEQCRHRNYFQCNSCQEICSTNEATQAERGHICKDCADHDYVPCDNCSLFIREGDENYTYDGDGNIEETLCSNCYEREENVRNRNYSTSNAYVEEGKRIYAVEVECFPTRSSMSKIVKGIAKEIGISHDGSLDGPTEGREFITPKLSGIIGKTVLKTLCGELMKSHATVNKTCGLHVHIDMTDVINSVTKIKDTFLFYLAFEPVIFSYLPMSRRTNRFCMPLSEFYHAQEIADCRDQEKLEAIWYREQSKETRENRKQHKYDESRYAGINFHSLFAHKNIEIRYHSGTVDFNKIDMWIKLHVAIIDAIAKGMSRDEIDSAKFIVDMKEKQEKMFSLIDLPDNVKSYFMERQEKFGITTKENKDICAE